MTDKGAPANPPPIADAFEGNVCGSCMFPVYSSILVKTRHYIYSYSLLPKTHTSIYCVFSSIPRYLFANVRPWPEGYHASIEDPLDPPPPVQDVFIHVIDLVDMRDLGPMYRSHKACFSERYNYMYLDASDEYVARFVPV